MRRVLSILILLILAITSLPNVDPNGYGSYPPPNSGDWIIINETLVENETIILNGNLTIKEGGNLTLKNVVLKLNCRENGSYHIEIKTGGSMFIHDNSNITSNTPDGSHRFNFWVRKGAKFDMRNSELHECGYFVGYTALDNEGLYIESDNPQIISSYFSNNYRGVIIENISMAYFYDSKFENNTYGIESRSSHNNSIINCSFKYNFDGIELIQSKNNTIINNQLSNNHEVGLYLIDSENFYFINNTINDNFAGTDITLSNGVFKNNIYNNNTYNYGFLIENTIFNYNLTIDTSNLINGAPLYFLVNLHNVEISPETGFDKIGFLSIINSENVTVKNVTLSDNLQGLLLLNSTNCKICNVNFTNNKIGLYLEESSHNNVTDCNFIKNHVGISLSGNSDYNVIENCKINNNERGVTLWDGPSYNIISNCNISNGRYGIRIALWSENNSIQNCNITQNEKYGITITRRSNNNQIYFNNFLQNNVHAISNLTINQWDLGENGGNYWDDYEGLDDGTNNRAAEDGIGDINLPHIGLDNNPYMRKDGWLNYTPVDRDNDGIPDIIDIDDDNDGYNDSIEIIEGTDPLVNSSMPNDYDKDFIPDSIDPDIDNDGIPNEEDDYPYDETRWKIEDTDLNWVMIIAIIVLLTIAAFVIGLLITRRNKKGKIKT